MRDARCSRTADKGKLCSIAHNLEECSPGVVVNTFPTLSPKNKAIVNDTEPRGGVKPL